MQSRFLFAAGPDVDAVWRNLSALRRQLPTAETVLRSTRLLAIVAGRHGQLGPDGLIVGPLFMRGRDGPVMLSESDQRLAIASSGQWLVDQCWGGYVALIGDPSSETVQLVRAPLGDLPCYWSREGSTLLLASDLALLRAATAGRHPIDPEMLARHLAAPDLRTGRTCLTGISEIQGGERLRVEGATAVTETIWSPWRFMSRKRQLGDRAEAARRVRDATLHCVAARASEHKRILLKLSGGLDSSIVAASLASAKIGFCALNLVTKDPLGDERDHARAVAHYLDVPLTERLRDPRGVDLALSAAARLPRPSARAFTQESQRAAGIVAADSGCDAVFDGGGGDNLFCSLQSARPAADCLMSGAGSGYFWSTATAIAQLSQASLWMVALRAWATSRRTEGVAYPWHVDTRFLSPEASVVARPAGDHPWLAAPDQSLPGKVAHVALIAAAQSVAEGADVEDALPTFSPLISQPLAEACLLTPSWMWFGPRGNRAVAREAFASTLPAAIIERRSKGAPDSFIAELFEASRPLLRTMLLDGNLQRLGLLDRPAVEASLAATGPLRGHDYLRLMQLADAEAWTGCWV